MFGGIEFKDLSLDVQAEIVEVIDVALANHSKQLEAHEPGVPFTEVNLAMAMGIDSVNELPAGVYNIFLKIHDYIQP